MNKTIISKLFLQHTPYEIHDAGGKAVQVKRDDLFCHESIAPLAKMRGVNRVMERVASEGIKTVGVYDFKVSRAGVGISAMARYHGLRCIECYPWYTSYIETGLPRQQIRCAEWGAELYPILASRISINYAVAKRHVLEREGYMFPRGIVLEETLEAVEEEVEHDKDILASFNTIVVCAGSGTIVTGLMRGLKKCGMTHQQIHAVCCTDSVVHCRRLHRYLCDESIFAERPRIQVHPATLTYYTENQCSCPFPSHPNYDRKAWDWMTKNIDSLKGPVLFWNIGA